MTVKRLICVDDEPFILKSLQRSFRKDGYELLFAGSGLDALSIFERVQPIQVILSDFIMAGINGLDLIRMVKATRPHVVGIILTGYANVHQCAAALDEKSIFAVIHKPWDLDLLRRTVARAMEQYEIDAAAAYPDAAS